MAQLAIAALGAGLGSAAGIGASAGWLIGSFIGNALFAKGSHTEGPRLGDLTVQSATEGVPITIAFGTVRIAGNLIWSGGSQETKTTEKQGGKGLGGSSSATTYTYSASFALGICEGVIQGVRKIWADGKLIYNVTANASAATLYASQEKLGAIRIYPGSASQAADPTIQAAQGAADTPAFRNLAYIVFTDLQLANFANRIPNITVEIITVGTGTAPWQVHSYSPILSNPRNIVHRKGVIERATYSVSDLGSSIRMTQTYDRFLLNGTLVSSATKTRDYSNASLSIGGHSGISWLPATGDPRLSYMQVNAVGTDSDSSELFYDVEALGEAAPYSSDYYYQSMYPNGRLVILGGYLFSIQSSTGANDAQGITRRKLFANGRCSKEADKIMPFVVGVHKAAADGVQFTYGCLSAGDDGLLYLKVDPSGIPATIFSYDLDLNEIAVYTYPAAYPSGSSVSGCAVHGGYLMDFRFSGSCKCRLYQLTEPELTIVGEIGVSPSSASEECASLGSGLVLHTTGVYSMFAAVAPTPVTLASINLAIAQRCGMTAGQLDLITLTDQVDGFAIGRHASGRADLEPLRQAYLYDFVESSAQLKAVKRGGTSVATFTEDHLGFDGSSALVRVSRQQEFELPVQVNVGYLDLNNDYQPGSQQARRLISPSKHVVDLELPIVFSSTKGAQVADILIRNAWEERTHYELQATRKHAHLEPTDLVTLPSGALARIVMTEWSDSGALRIEAVSDAAAHYSSDEVGNDASSESLQDIPIGGPTLLHVLDIPALETANNLSGFYVAAAGYYSGWRGCEIQYSTDAGVSYQPIFAITNDAVIGHTTTVLQTCTAPTQVDVFGEVTIDLINDSYTLSSVTDAQLLEGRNLCALRSGAGWELLCFGVATLSTPGTYTLSRFVRGLFGTEALVGGHAAGDAFVLIRASVRFVTRAQADVGVTRMIRATTFGEIYAQSDSNEVTNSGNSQRPLAPSHLSGEINRITRDWTLSWKRRARLNFWWFDFVDVDLDESSESYRVRIRDDTGAVIRTIEASAATVNYSGAQQLADFEQHQNRITWEVCQLSAQVGEGQVASAGTVITPLLGAPDVVLYSLIPVLYIYTWTSTTVVDDLSINNLNGTFTGTKTVNLSPTGILADITTRYVAFSAGGYATIAHNALHLFKRKFSVIAWARWTSTGTQGIFGKYLSGADYQYLISTTSTGTLNFQILVNGSSRTATFAGGYNDGIWHCIVGVDRIDSSGGHAVDLYVDGVLRNTDSGDSSGVDLDSTTQPLSIGAYATGGSPFTGDIGTCLLIGQDLTAEQILGLYNNGIRI